MTDEDVVHPDAAEQATQETPEQQAEREEAEGQLNQEGQQEQQEGSEQQDNGEEDAAAKRNKRVQKRIDQLTKQRHEALRQVEELREANRRLQESQTATPPADDPRPSFDDYGSVEKFQQDYDQWARRQAKREAEATQQSESANVDQQAAMDRIENAAIEAADRFPDFEQVVYDPSLPLTQDMVNAAAETDHVADVLYHLGKNREEAQRLSQLTGTSLVREIGRLEARLEAQSSGNGAAQGQQEQSQPTSAPEPIKTVKGGGAKREPTNPDEMDIDTWMARERERIAKQRR